MSMPRCQPARRRPNVDVTGPSTGHVNAGEASTKSGTNSMRLCGLQHARGPQHARRRGAVGRDTVAASAVLGERVGGGALAAAAGMVSRWPILSGARALGRWLAAISLPTVTP